MTDLQIPKYCTIASSFILLFFLQADSTTKYGGLWNFPIIRPVEVLLGSKMITISPRRYWEGHCVIKEKAHLTYAVCCYSEGHWRFAWPVHLKATTLIKQGRTVWSVSEIRFHLDYATATAKCTTWTRLSNRSKINYANTSPSA